MKLSLKWIEKFRDAQSNAFIVTNERDTNFLRLEERLEWADIDHLKYPPMTKDACSYVA